MGTLGFLCALGIIASDQDHHWDGSPIVTPSARPSVDIDSAVPITAKPDGDNSDGRFDPNTAKPVGGDTVNENDLVPANPVVEDITVNAHPVRDRLATMSSQVAIPTILTLLVGWEVVGFRQQDNARKSQPLPDSTQIVASWLLELPLIDIRASYC
jgi:hypothetical protein